VILALAELTRMNQSRSVDWMCIGIEKITEGKDSAQYAFISDVRELDPNFRRRMIVVCQNQGVLEIAKATGEVTLIRAMPEDDGDKRFARAAAKIHKHWEAGEYPEKTLFASG